uniref:LapA family protein n=1 Tax=Marinobacterium profundum TaxID=1714300 RepID=UPI000835E1B2|nr:LapA family protein [Marinobacterium profundum]
MEYIHLILVFLVGAFLAYLSAYSKAKGKNKALHEDIARLEEEKQAVIAKFQAETEELKKSHTLDIEKRKHQYSAKREQFVKFFSMLDDYNSSCHVISMEKFPPILNDFLGAYMNGTEEDQAKANLIFSNRMNKLFTELNQELIKVRHETSTIRIISSPEMDSLLDKLDIAVQASTNDSSEMLKFMSTQEFWADQSLIAPYQERSETSAKELMNIKASITNRMKRCLST